MHIYYLGILSLNDVLFIDLTIFQLLTAEAMENILTSWKCDWCFWCLLSRHIIYLFIFPKETTSFSSKLDTFKTIFCPRQIPSKSSCHYFYKQFISFSLCRLLISSYIKQVRMDQRQQRNRNGLIISIWLSTTYSGLL